jgi:hypothetical protein
MDLTKLSEVVSKEARAEADQLIQAAQFQAEETLKREKLLTENRTKERFEEENNQFTSKLNYLRFNFESDFKKRVLHLKHSIMEDLQSRLYNAAIETIKTQAMLYLESVLKKSPVKTAVVYISSELDSIFNANTLKNYNTATGSVFSWGGVDTALQLGMAIENGPVRYIFPLSENIQHFIEQHAVDINEKFFA